MIELITGLPGSGKSASLVARILEWTQGTRPVYAYGIEALNVPGVHPLDDPNRWQELPDGALIVVDEVQKVWPTRRGGAPIPPVAALSEHRHRGFDFLLATQHPSMLDPHVRRLVGKHRHLERKFGAKVAKVYTWEQVCEDLKSTKWRQSAVLSAQTLQPRVWDLYKSASVHTHRARLPKVAHLLWIVPLVGILYGIYAWANLEDQTEAVTKKPDAPAVDALSAVMGVQQPPPAASAAPRYLSPEQWVAKFTPRVDGIPWSAPAFDGMEATEYPVPLCVLVESQRRCSCYTQQGTRLTISYGACSRIARDGIFLPLKKSET